MGYKIVLFGVNSTENMVFFSHADQEKDCRKWQFLRWSNEWATRRNSYYREDNIDNDLTEVAKEELHYNVQRGKFHTVDA
jgi:hypothetical protein